jgi:hypothetical protein
LDSKTLILEPNSEVGSYTSTKNDEVKEMEVVMMVKINTPKEPERNKNRYEFMAEYMRPYYDKKVKEGVKWNANGARAYTNVFADQITPTRASQHSMNLPMSAQELCIR